MDLPLLRNLQAMEAIEKDLTLEFDLDEIRHLHAMYEHTVLVNQALKDEVDLNHNMLDGKIWFRLRNENPSAMVWETNSLTRAMTIANIAPGNWTIALQGGL